MHNPAVLNSGFNSDNPINIQEVGEEDEVTHKSRDGSKYFQ